jgi:hypothetical protein
MRLENQTSDGKSHTGALELGGKEGVSRQGQGAS